MIEKKRTNNWSVRSVSMSRTCNFFTISSTAYQFAAAFDIRLEIVKYVKASDGRTRVTL